ncbi:hypothetical protein AMJ39_07155 [candidate division TA06 bacterium DG_24]|uniref:Uncharacterized protein n=3 Tax=Bacteria division TA06 TaxID=1156500 RepID=A0A0S8JM41_UNCT6|nr:MAG: hypothetical protein AMJ39_07155 [candidate division TA06 bacterium DG_24]KPK67182.1 MAG: hypothetical protein AMJ82_11105 [candidate division TA06 bacterium SM23_40]KPL10758.1 MAG: hypothetical protein AMJ71_02115 [candidate division TA06 bacterium SM1_40]
MLLALGLAGVAVLTIVTGCGRDSSTAPQSLTVQLSIPIPRSPAQGEIVEGSLYVLDVTAYGDIDLLNIDIDQLEVALETYEADLLAEHHFTVEPGMESIELELELDPGNFRVFVLVLKDDQEEIVYAGFRKADLGADETIDLDFTFVWLSLTPGPEPIELAWEAYPDDDLYRYVLLGSPYDDLGWGDVDPPDTTEVWEVVDIVNPGSADTTGTDTLRYGYTTQYYRVVVVLEGLGMLVSNEQQYGPGP